MCRDAVCAVLPSVSQLDHSGAGPLWWLLRTVLLPIPWPESRVWGLLVSLVTRLYAQHHCSWRRAVAERDPSWCPAVSSPEGNAARAKEVVTGGGPSYRLQMLALGVCLSMLTRLSRYDQVKEVRVGRHPA